MISGRARSHVLESETHELWRVNEHTSYFSQDQRRALENLVRNMEEMGNATASAADDGLPPPPSLLEVCESMVLSPETSSLAVASC